MSNEMNEYAITELAKMGLDMEPKGAGHHIRKFFERKNITPLQASKKRVFHKRNF